MNDLISRQAAIKDVESWVAVDEYEKHLQKNVVEWLKEFPSTEHGMNMTQVGTDLISRQQAIDTAIEATDDWDGGCNIGRQKRIEKYIKQLPSVEPKIIHCEDCKYGMLNHSFPHQWFCKFKGDEWNNSDYFCGHARKREVTT